MIPSMHRMRTLALFAALLAGSANAATLTHHYDFASGVDDQVGTQDGVPIGHANVAGGTLNLDGIDDYVQFATQIVPLSGSYSVALFAERASNSAAFTEMISQGTSGGPGFYLGTDPTGRIRATDQWGVTGVTAGAVGVMTHYALVVDAVAGHSKLYVDGLQVASLGTAIATGSAGSPTRFGRQFGGLAEYFHGSIDDVRIYSGALTAQEVAALAAPVPEPGTCALTALGLLGIGASVRAQRRRA